MVRALIKNGTVFDGNKLVGKADVLIDGGRISRVGEVAEAEAKADVVIDARDYFVMPGLIDAHLHLTGIEKASLGPSILLEPRELRLLRAVKDLERLVNAGFTTIRDCGEYNTVFLKMAVNKGIIRGPRILAAGRPLSQTFGHGDLHFLPVDMVERLEFARICDGVDECRRAARDVLREGSDFIKVMATGGVMSQRDRPEWSNFSLEELRVIVEEASKVGTYVAAHAHGDRGIRIAVEAGVRTIEHGSLASTDTLKLIRERGVYLIPTLSVQDSIIRYGKEAGVDEWALQKINDVMESVKRVVPEAYRMGVKIATGTDFSGARPGFEMGTNAKEILLLNEMGSLSPLDALRSATSIAAEAIGLGNITGTIEPGKAADIIMVRGNPLEDLKVLMDSNNIALVIINGEIAKRLI
jgi:imidazolonepropionase-like amidohydrolase